MDAEVLQLAAEFSALKLVKPEALLAATGLYDHGYGSLAGVLALDDGEFTALVGSLGLKTPSVRIITQARTAGLDRRRSGRFA